MNRTIFCAYWLYFYGFRGVFGGMRVLDQLGMSLAVLGLINLLSTERLNFRLVGWVAILLCPLALAAILDPSIYIILYVFKIYVVAIYFTGYFKSMRLTLVEFVCFAVPVVVSVYFFLYPAASAKVYLLKGRMIGISEPNFTSLSLIYAMCGAFGIYVLTKIKWAKVTAIVITLICFVGVVLTASRAGFIGVTIALCLFLIIEKKARYVLVVATIITALYPTDNFKYRPVVFQRFQASTGGFDAFMANTSGRDRFMELAWDEIHRREWFIGGGPKRVSKWGKYRSVRVPHNSLLDVGLAFGKASFYFYGALLIALLAVNLQVVMVNWRCRNYEEKNKLLTPIFFLSLLPMYLSLSAGMTMGFILWMVLGAYPLFDASPKLVKVPS